MNRNKKMTISLVVLMLFGMLYFFYLKDWIKPVALDLNAVENITYFNNKPEEAYENVMLNVLEQCRGSLPISDSMEYHSTNYDLGFERYVAYDNESKHLSIDYYFYDKENIDAPLGQTESYVYVNIISNKSVMGSDQDPDENELMSGTYFYKVNSLIRFKQWGALVVS